MPSHERTRQFDRDWEALTEFDRKQFLTVFRQFEADLGGGSFRSDLGVRHVEGTDVTFEMKWAPGGHATFDYEASKRGNAHVVWRRIRQDY